MGIYNMGRIVRKGYHKGLFYDKRKGYTTWEGLIDIMGRIVLSKTKGIYNMGRIVLSQTKGIYSMGRIVL